jgi:aflatoxin B1 aldehyde reductase
VDHLDTYFLHCWDYQTPIEETLSAFDEQYRKDTFNLFGVSNISPEQLQMVIDICENNGELSIKPHVYQGMYNIYCRRIDHFFTSFQISQ